MPNKNTELEHLDDVQIVNFFNYLTMNKVITDKHKKKKILELNFLASLNIP